LLLAALESPPRESSRSQCTGISTGGLFFDAYPGVPVRDDGSLQTALKKRLAAVATRSAVTPNRRRVMAVTAELALVLDDILAMDLGLSGAVG